MDEAEIIVTQDYIVLADTQFWVFTPPPNSGFITEIITCATSLTAIVGYVFAALFLVFALLFGKKKKGETVFQYLRSLVMPVVCILIATGIGSVIDVSVNRFLQSDAHLLETEKVSSWLFPSQINVIYPNQPTATDRDTIFKRSMNIIH